MNNFSGIGRVGGDPVITETRDKKPICTFSVAIDSGYGDKKQTTWIKVALFDKRASVADYIRKGDRIGVNGEIVLRDWTDKQGVVQKSLELANANVTLLMAKREESRPAPVQSESNHNPFNDDDVPF